jgi:hypothetical protein
LSKNMYVICEEIVRKYTYIVRVCWQKRGGIWEWCQAAM